MSTQFIPGTDPEDVVTGAVAAEAIEEQVAQEQEQGQAEESAEADTQPAQNNELDALREKARVYDLIDSDPNLSQMVLDYMRNKNGVAPDPAPKRPATNSDETVAELRQKMAAMEQGQKQLLAMIAVSQFEAEHPDFKQYKQEVGKLLRQHPTFTLQEAYDHVKTTKVGRANNVARVPSVTAEGRNRAASNDNGSLKSLRTKILDTKATKSFDQAFDLALEYARQQHRGNE